MSTKLGVTYALLSAATYGLMSYLVHWNPDGIPPGQMLFIRSVVTIAVLLPFYYKETPKYFKKDSLFLWTRSITGAVGAFCYFYVLQGTVSANANFLYSSSPVFVGIMAWIFFREKISPKELFGIMLVVLANILLYLPNRNTMPTWVWLVGLLGAFFASFAFLSIGEAIKRYSSALIVLGFAFVCGLLALFYPETWVPIQKGNIVFLLVVGLLGLISQITATNSFAHLKSPIATTIGRTSVLFSGILDIFAAGYRPHILEWVSYLVVLLGIFFSVSKKRGARVK